MKKEEIEQAAKEWADNFDSYDPTFAGIKRMTAEISYRKGAEMLNERQPYSREDMIDFGVELLKRTHVIANRFVVNANLKLWEETQ